MDSFTLSKEIKRQCLTYVLGAVSVPEDASQQEIAPALAGITAGKYTAVEVQVIAGETVSVDLALP